MTPDRYAAICDLFDRAQQLSPNERTHFLEQACGNDPTLLQEVHDMLAHAPGDADDPLARLPCPMNLKTLLDSSCTQKIQPGQRIGPYRIEGLVGKGGMGTVFKAIRVDDYSQAVAVKVLRPGLETEEFQQRFRTERQVLAGLNHPNIARLLDGGATESGQPYFVMEYIEGEAITRYCERQQLSTRERVQLIHQVCGAVEHAHERGIIHRDLKPGNILVQRSEVRSQKSDGAHNSTWLSDHSPLTSDLRPLTSDLCPKIVDFGLAKCFIGDSQFGALDQTQTGAVLGTPSYMAPEQASGRVRDIGPAADVYALGAILYELLAGRPPFRGETSFETLQQVLGTDPLSPRQLHPGLCRDLETICMKCLRKEPARRYASAAALALDLERYLDGRPIEARPISLVERTRKWVRRRPAAAALFAVSLLAIISLTLGAWWHQARLQKSNDDLQAALEETKKQHARAEESFRQSREAVDYYLDKLIESAVLKEPRLRGIRRELLTEGLRYYQAFALERREDPSLGFEVAKAQFRIGQVHGQLGEQQAAVSELQHAVALFEQRVQATPQSVRDRRYLAWSYEELGILEGFLGRAEAAQRAKKRSLELREQVAREAPDKPLYRAELARIYHNLGVEQGEANQLADAYRSFERAAQLNQELCAQNSNNVDYQLALAIARQEMGKVKGMRGDLTGALELHRLAFVAREKVARAQPNRRGIDFELASSLLEIAQLHAEQGLPNLALADFAQSIERLERVYQKDQANGAVRGMLRLAYQGRAQAASSLEQYARAVPDLDRAVELAAGPERAEARLQRGRVWALDGDLRRATAEAKAVADEHKNRPALLFLAARVYAIASRKAKDALDQPTSERELHAEEYAIAGIGLLARVQTISGFGDANLRTQLMQEPDLASLRSREDYRKLEGAASVSKKSP
jgi:serine/threonine-protein kinase